MLIPYFCICESLIPLRNRRSEVGGVGSPIFYSRPPLTIRASMLHNTISRPPQGLENRNMTIVSSTNVYWQIKDKYIEGLQAAFNDFEFHKNNVLFSKPSKRIDIDFFFMIFSRPGRRRCRCTGIVMCIAQTTIGFDRYCNS